MNCTVSGKSGMYKTKIMNIAINLMPESLMLSEKKEPINVVPINELKQQVNERNRQSVGSVSVIPEPEVQESWSKYPCKEEKTCIRSHCFDGFIGITMKGGDIKGYRLVLMAIHESHMTYIVQDRQYDKLMEDGMFDECRTALIWYNPG